MGWKRTSIFLSLGALLLILIVPAVFYFLLPRYLNSAPFSEMIRSAGLEGFTWEVRNIGATGADIAWVRLGPEDQEAFSADVLRLDYHPAELTGRHVKRIFISGVEFHCAYREGKFSIRGLDPGRFTEGPPPESDAAKASFPLDLPFSFESLEIQNAVVFFTRQDDSTYRIPLQASFSLEKQGEESVLHGTIHLLPRNQKITFALKAESASQTVHLKVTADRFHPERFADLVGTVPGLRLAGELDLEAEGAFRWNPFEIASGRASLRFRNTGSAYREFQLQAAEAGAPLRMEVQTTEGRNWRMSAGGFALASPVPLGVTDLEARVEQKSGGIRTSGHFKLFLEKNGDEKNLPFQVIDPLHLGLGFSSRFGEEGAWDFGFKNIPSDVNPSRGWGVQIREQTIHAGSPEVTISGRGGPDGGQAEYRITLPGPEAAGEVAAAGTALSLKGDVRFDRDGTLNGSMELTASDAVVRTPELEIHLPRSTMAGTWKISGAGPLNVDGAFSLAEGRIDHSASETRLTGIRGNIPLKWPWAASEKRGEFSVAGIRWRDRRIGSLTGSLQQSRKGVAFTGNASAEPLPGATIAIDGSSNFRNGANRTEIRFDGGVAVEAPLDLSTLLPEVQGVTVNGRMEWSGTLISDSTGTSASAVMALENGNLRVKTGDLAAENIQLELVMPDLLNLRSGPGQVLTVEKIAIGKILMNDFRVQFQVESGESVLLEKARVQWCDGLVSAQALRIFPGVDEYDIILYCDRLNLADLLEQFGVAQAAGEGAVNGRIPVRYSDGKILFDDGFLYSTPGAGGTIQVTGAQMLTAGIPEGTPQYAQIDLAREALKNYEYDWVRIRMETEGEMLVLDLQFDGQPVDPLPFVYKAEAGGFVRMEAGGQVSRFQGIRLNVNLEVPLNKILRFKGIWDMLQ